MRKRLLFVAGITVGYIVGARAGRPAYDALVERVRGAAESPTAMRVGEKAKDALEEKAPKIAGVVEKVAATASGAAVAATEAGSAPSKTTPADEPRSPDPAV